LLTLPTVLIELLFARVVFHVTNLGDLLSLFVLVTVGTISFASLGLVVASVTNTMQETPSPEPTPLASADFSLWRDPAHRPTCPKSRRRVAVFLPATYLVSGLQGAMYSSFAIWKLLTQISCSCALDYPDLFRSRAAFSLGSPNPKSRAAPNSGFSRLLFLFFCWVFGENKNGKILNEAQAAYRSLDRPASTDNQPQA